jgi:hypothetical protein
MKKNNKGKIHQFKVTTGQLKFEYYPVISYQGL